MKTTGNCRARTQSRTALRFFASLRETASCRSIVAAVGLTLLPLPLIAQQTERRTLNKSSSKLVPAAPESAGMSRERLAKIDEAVLESISRKETPGAVVLVARKGRIVYRKAFGDRTLEPKREPTTVDTIFDLASLTKVVATATSIMILVERGKISLADPVALYIPEFGKFGKERITVEQLMTHRAGLPPDNEIADYVGKGVDPLQQIYELRPVYEPGTRFVYSDVGFIIAAEIVWRVSGKRIDTFAREAIFGRLGMKDTDFHPIPIPGSYSDIRKSSDRADPIMATVDYRFAPTENRNGRWMR